MSLEKTFDAVDHVTSFCPAFVTSPSVGVGGWGGGERDFSGQVTPNGKCAMGERGVAREQSLYYLSRVGIGWQRVAAH